MANGIAHRTMNLWNAAQGVRVLHPPAIAMRFVDLTARQQPPHVCRDFDLPCMRTCLVNPFIERRVGSLQHVEGESLVQVIQRLGVADMLDWRRALRIAVHVARALAFLHGRHVVHRNVAPQNILLRSRNREAVLGDLMLAKCLDAGPEEPGASLKV